MSLECNVINATNVPNVETIGKSDPIVQVELQGVKKKTEVRKGELDPTWNETLNFDLGGTSLQSQDVLKLSVFDWEMVGRNRLLGTGEIPMKQLIQGSKTQKFSISLVDGHKRPTSCTLNVSVTYRPPPGAGGGGGGGMGGTVVQQDDEEEEEDEDEDFDDDVDETDGGKKKKKKKKKKKRAGARKMRGPLSTKPQDFQVRIKIVEARQLPGANICPVARVTCYNQTKQTRVQKSTNSPFWNEVFFFNFFCAPSELFDELIEFGVYNSRNLRSDAFIGSFKCDVGLVFDEPGHSLVNKWLLLSDPDDQMSGAKGYLKICATVLGPGDDAPSFKPSTQEEDEDIESNLLRPAGVMLRPATFKLKLYRAEDIPRMDSDFMQGVKKVFGSDEKKELVDPYFVFSFAGSEIRSKIIYTCDHPEWNQELCLGLRFPSMCERIRLQMFDWDRFTETDPVCTGFVDLRQIARPGEIGFLPTFGPCYINFYGSTREYSDLPDEYEDLNLGKGEGVAYRGRALVELETILGEMPEQPIGEINNDDLLRVQKFMRRRKYKLNAAFMNATMISEVDAPVEFEVTIGNYGNKLDVTVPPCASTTQPTNAVFDGCYYYFLPWADTKPCVVVDSHWEDISFRLEALNMILYIIERLESNLDKVRVGLKANLQTPELAQLLISTLDQLHSDCKKPLPQPVDGHHIQNDLDRQIRAYREAELHYVAKHAAKLRESATDVGEALNEVETYLAQLKSISTEPQNSMPDVVIWMISGGKRVAFYRCPAHLVLWSEKTDYRGKFCGKLETIQLRFPGNQAEKDNKWEIPALIRMKVWLGLEKHQSEWHRMQTEGELAVFAETYENQVNILGNWTTKGPTMTRPRFSDAAGRMKLDKEAFKPPPGWRWDTDWYISPELSMLYDKDAGHTSFLEDVYEAESRIPGGTWQPASIPWTDVKGDSTIGKDEIELPFGWEWDEDWAIDLNRAVDEYGWEYTVEATVGGFGPVERTYHLCRRRRWVRNRKLVKDVKMEEEENQLAKEAAEGWEYAPLFNMKFHHKERKMDLVRRRRYHRKMVADNPNSPCFFKIPTSDTKKTAAAMATSDEDESGFITTAPRMFLTCKKPNKYQLRAYIYQARDLLAGDSNGLSDPFARVVFLNQSQVTEKLDKTLCPTWDQTLLYNEVNIHGDPEDIAIKPPEVIIEIFDHDTFGSAEFLGRTHAYPMVKLDPSDMRTPVLQWYSIQKGTQYGGELLAAFELFLMNGKDLPFAPPKKGKLFLVPNGIRPVMQRTAIEVMCWGVRNMRKFQLASVTSPSIEFEVGGHVVQSKQIKNTKKNPNFDEPLLFFDVMLPKEELYTPPINIRVRDNRQFGRKPMVGVHVLKSLEEFRCEPARDDTDGLELPGDLVGNGPPAGTGEVIIDMGPSDEKGPLDPSKSKSFLQTLKQAKVAPLQLIPGKKKEEKEDFDEEIDWWSKYYASTGELTKCKSYLEKGYDTIMVYPTSLEKVLEYGEFADFCHTFPLSRGKSLEEEESNIVGEFKGTFRVYPLPPDPNQPMPKKVLDNLPPSTPEECIIRVYIIKAVDLQPNDPSGLADPYVTIQIGKHKKDNKDEYVPNSLSPVFGKMFEVKAMMPIEKDLYIRIKDYDLFSTDDVIGETVIDLENRYLSKHKATVGLPKTYSTSGPCVWRHAKKPKEILEEFCAKHNIIAPVYTGSQSVKVGNRTFNLADFEVQKPTHHHLGAADQRLALHVLNLLPKSVGCPWVPEHVETRPLYNPLQPGIEQGKLQMWVDIFPLGEGDAGPPADINARTPRKYELRIIVWNTTDVILEEESITGEKMSDIYVKGWISGIDEKQETDVHYRSLDGEGNFNWRFVFPFEYLPAEESLVVKRKEHFWSLDETELHLAPILMMQIWDNDKFSADDFLGTVELNMNKMPAPAKKSSSCTLDILPDVDNKKEIKTISLFEQKRVKGFWPCYNDETGKRELTGKIEMEIELLVSEEAETKPTGQGRDEPNEHPHLDPPKRPETSFLWFTSPWKTFKHIIWRRYKWHFIIGIIVLLLIVFIALFIYSFPGAAAGAMF